MSPYRRTYAEIAADQARAKVEAEFAAQRRLKVQTVINLTEVDAECIHGALPLDRKKPAECRCWTEGATDALARRAGLPGAA